VQIKQSFSSK